MDILATLNQRGISVEVSTTKTISYNSTHGLAHTTGVRVTMMDAYTKKVCKCQGADLTKFTRVALPILPSMLEDCMVSTFRDWFGFGNSEFEIECDGSVETIVLFDLDLLLPKGIPTKMEMV